MRSIILVSAAIILLFLVSSSSAVDDFRLIESNEIELKEQSNGLFSVKHKVISSKIFLSDYAAKSDTLVVFEGGGNDIKGFKAFLNGKRLKWGSVFSLYYKDWGEFFGHEKVKLVKLPDSVAAGDTLKWLFQRESRDKKYAPLIFVPSRGRIEDLRVLVKHPSDYRIEFQQFTPSGELPLEVQYLSDRETVLSIKGVSGPPELEYYRFNGFLSIISIRVWPVGTEKPDPVGELVDWYTTQTDLEPTLDSAGQRLARQIVKDVGDDPRAKLQKIYDYVSAGVRYILDAREEHMFIPYNATLTLERKYGDCKDQSNLIAAMARAVGIRVALGLVTHYSFIPLEFVHPNLFDHVVAVYEDSAGYLMMDPTFSSQGYFGMMDRSIQKGWILVCDPQRPRQVVYEPQLKGPLVDLAIRTNLENIREAEAEITFRDQMAADLKYYRLEYDDQEFEMVCRSAADRAFYQIEFSDFDLIDEEKRLMSFSAKADLSQFLLAAGSEMYVPKSAIQSCTPRIMDRLEDSLAVYYRQAIRFRLQLDIAGVTRNSPVDSAMLEDGLGCSLLTKIEKTGGDTVRLVYDVIRRPIRIEKESKAAHLEYCRQLLAGRADLFELNLKAGEEE